MLWLLAGCLLLAEPPEIVAGASIFGGDTASATPEELGEPLQVGVGYSDACVVYDSGAIACSGYTKGPEGIFVDIEGGLFDYCGITADNELICEDDKGGPSEAESVDIGESGACAIKDGALKCWGSNTFGVADPPSGSSWVRVAVGTFNGCAVSESGSAKCWSDDSRDDVNDVPSGDYLDIATADFTACGIRDDGTIRCWGSSLEPAPSGSYVAIEAGEYHYCALRDDGDVKCWGDDDYQQSSPPGDSFESFDSGGLGNCGITTDHEVKCWGKVEEGEW
ncbi:hypothetical protein LBMAG42_11500 [Deltaproteobacteria bacterium]|nr:hypothetical protein LBMAG42_11500 [Deltaproteobacteria bacterium]